MSNRKRVVDKQAQPAAFTLIETVLALSFLAITAGLTLKIHQARMDFDQDSMDRLAVQLNIENIAERLSIVPYTDLPDATKQVNREGEFIAKIDSFESKNGNGWHVQIRSDSADQSMTTHLWKLEPKP